ncbi:sulfatase-like hydrolase/transferase [Paenibacillus sp. PL2-23]|uniref:sulfatase-like hydrolase/transferase n=1 Tax=Paenibacillus sp. PL2-23 TaxID=2100729 RepID=UPI0030F9AD38
MKQPNVIVFFTDQQRWDTTGAHGNPMGLTPVFDRMAARGTFLAQSFSCQPVCGPARSCLQSGMYATTTGCYRNGIALPEDTPTLAHYYKKAGYHTGYIGKWHLAGQEPVSAQRRGSYEAWLGANCLESVSDAYNTILYDNDDQEVFLPGYRVDAMTDASIRYIHDHKDQPFFLFVSYLEPHHQNHRDDYPAPIGYEERYRGGWTPPDLQALGGSVYQHLAGYYGMVKRLDEALGRILDALISMDLEQDTIVLFTSDHGNHFKTRNGEYKRSCHDSSIRVPTAVQGPGFWRGGHMENLVSLIDLPPTLLDACGIEVPDAMQGQSLMPCIRGQASGWQEEVFIQISEVQVERAVRTKRWKYSVHAPHKDGWADMGSDEYEEYCLYDLLSDPYELTNLIGMVSHRKTADHLKARLLRRMEEAGEAVPVVRDAPAIQSGQRRVDTFEIHA